MRRGSAAKAVEVTSAAEIAAVANHFILIIGDSLEGKIGYNLFCRLPADAMFNPFGVARCLFPPNSPLKHSDTV